MELLVVLAVAVHLAVPLKPSPAERDQVKLQQERPDGLAIEKVLESLRPAVVQQFGQTFHIVFSLSITHTLTFL